MSYDIVEGRKGLWNYHIAAEGETTALCGANVMPCGTERWDAESRNARDSYCEECGDRYARLRTEEAEEVQNFFTWLWERVRRFVV